MKTLIPAAAFALLAGTASAETTQLGPDTYKVDAGVAFTMSNDGASSYLFSWTDSSGTFTDILDPTFILSSGETYTFTRTTSAHPFVICNDTLPIAGTDGSFTRTTSDGAVIDAATLTPIADFTADPAPTKDLISWTLSDTDIAIYYYTCRVTGHADMTGKIEVVAADEPCLPDVNGDGMVTPTDFTAWINAFNNNLPECDQNGDGLCTPTDFTAWIANFNAGC
ncbi:MAG: hypothetical protein COB69_09015 [Phycisphaera sp.]|nr:MAG: hypothetical protein COB69_09015 [Phycisphaera sp.]